MDMRAYAEDGSKGTVIRPHQGQKPVNWREDVLPSVGIFMLLAGLGLLLYCVFAFDVGVATGAAGPDLPSHIVNYSLISQRECVALLGVALSVVGGIWCK